jgi:hypothetical protein
MGLFFILRVNSHIASSPSCSATLYFSGETSIKVGVWKTEGEVNINPFNAELNPICHLLALLGAHPILHIAG